MQSPNRRQVITGTNDDLHVHVFRQIIYALLCLDELRWEWNDRHFAGTILAYTFEI